MASILTAVTRLELFKDRIFLKKVASLQHDQARLVLISTSNVEEDSQLDNRVSDSVAK